MKPTSHSLILFIFFVAHSFSSFSQEICNNNIDDDGDRLIDLYDIEDCPCSREADTFKISLIPNPSFENLDSIPTYFSQLNYAQQWNQATWATSDLLCTDGFFLNEIPLPIPDGNNCVGTILNYDYLEYLGTCLNGPMLSGQSYSLKFNIATALYILNSNDFEANVPSIPIDLVLYGSTICEPFPVQEGPCWQNSNLIELDRISYQMLNQWTEKTMFFTPLQNIYSIILGGACTANPLNSINRAPYILWDNLQLNNIPEEVIYYVPNTFTPNGDEHNNLFNPVFVCGYDPLEYRFDVYNRWGEIVFTSLDAKAGWDGTYQGIPAKEGVFGWKLEYKADNTTEKKVLTGHANLLR